MNVQIEVITGEQEAIVTTKDLASFLDKFEYKIKFMTGQRRENNWVSLEANGTILAHCFPTKHGFNSVDYWPFHGEPTYDAREEYSEFIRKLTKVLDEDAELMEKIHDFFYPQIHETHPQSLIGMDVSFKSH